MKNLQSLITFLLKLASITGTINEKHRLKRGNTDNFNILLGIYKMKPLKHSDVFKAFSNRVLLPRPDVQHSDLNLNSNESRENRTNTKSKIEEIINYATRKSVIDQPLYIKDKERNDFNCLRPQENLDYNKVSKDQNEDQELTETVNLPSDISFSQLNDPVSNIKDTSPEKHAGPKVFNINDQNKNSVPYNEAEIIIV